MDPDRYGDHEAAWRERAAANLDEWGLQPPKDLALAMTEELGELTQALLEARHEDGDPEAIAEELDDLMALGYQFRAAIDREREGADRGDGG
ncbi:hypothetical protein BRD17_07550 [Halobacteriales archaeon SW_7_68_16]|nr:MAG: hypothetical protein BRD17_07550 [Halobacteriales archaeon SW_7_68_16]